MSSTIQVTVQSNLTVAETFSAGLPGSNTATFAPLNQTTSLNAGTAPAATKHAPLTVALSAGAATVDLTAIPGVTGDETVNGTGLKVQVIEFYNPPTNANSITAKFGASNPYNLLGPAWQFALAPGQSTGPINLAGAAPTIGSGAKNIDLSGTGSQSLSVHVVMG